MKNFNTFRANKKLYFPFKSEADIVQMSSRSLCNNVHFTKISLLIFQPSIPQKFQVKNEVIHIHGRKSLVPSIWLFTAYVNSHAVHVYLYQIFNFLMIMSKKSTI